METISQKFNEFHRKNPNVYLLFKQYAYEAHLRGEHKLGAKHIIEQIRWREKVKVSNMFTSRYVRKFVQDFPSYACLFVLRPINE